jgi:hypothetical protein
MEKRKRKRKCKIERKKEKEKESYERWRMEVSKGWSKTSRSCSYSSFLN